MSPPQTIAKSESDNPWTLSPSYVVATILTFALTIRAAVSLHPYSGESTPPKFGDYEAQRHWMELALNLPPLHWYRNTTHNDLSYWGLDYPPLSAYASWPFGKLVQFADPAAMELFHSRGYQSPASRTAMRLTVMLGDLIVFFSGLLVLLNCLYKKDCRPGEGSLNGDSWSPVLAFCTTLPALILIDNGHFQYNSISLGLFLFALAFFLSEREALGAVFFCCSLYFKHMGLYYGLAIFAFLTSRFVSLYRRQGLVAVIFVFKVSIAIILTTFVSFWPWIKSKEDMFQLLRRLFPLSRGLYEDKVANLWCSISILVKLHKLMDQRILFKFCAVVTILASLPFCVALAIRLSSTRLILSSSGCALAAYLFSYQVHEKQILIPLIPLSLLYGVYPRLCVWASYVAMFSLFPLLYREGLALAYAATSLAHFAVISATFNIFGLSARETWLASFSVGIGLILHFLLICGEPPARAPHMFVLLNTMYACAHLCLIYVCMLVLAFTSDTEQPLHSTKNGTCCQSC